MYMYIHSSDLPLAKIRQCQCRIVLIAPFWPQQPWFSEILLLLVSAPSRLPLFPRHLTKSKGKFLQNLTLPSRLGVIKQSIRGKKFPQMLQILSQNQDQHLLRKSMMPNGLYTLTGVIERRLILSRPLLQL